MADTIKYTVTTVAGSRQHEVSGEADNRLIADSIVQAYSGLNPGFYLLNPSTFYTLSNVISISYEGASGEFTDEIERLMGFLSDDAAVNEESADT